MLVAKAPESHWQYRFELAATNFSNALEGLNSPEFTQALEGTAEHFRTRVTQFKETLGRFIKLAHPDFSVGSLPAFKLLEISGDARVAFERFSFILDLAKLLEYAAFLAAHEQSAVEYGHDQ